MIPYIVYNQLTKVFTNILYNAYNNLRMYNLQGYYKYFNDQYRVHHDTFNTRTMYDKYNTNRQYYTMMHAT